MVHGTERGWIALRQIRAHRENLAKRYRPGWGSDGETDLIGARKFESLGQRDDAALAALGTAAELHDQIGPGRIEARIRFLAQRLKQGPCAGQSGTGDPSDRTAQSWRLYYPGRWQPGGEISNKLYSDHGISAAATGGLRLCPTITTPPSI